MYTRIRSIAEIEIDHSTTPGTFNQLNAYFAGGWVLLAIQTRSYDYTHQDGDACQFTVYIVGNTKCHAIEPIFDSKKGVWKCAEKTP